MTNPTNFIIAVALSMGLTLCTSSSVPNLKVFNYQDDMPIKAEHKEAESTETPEVGQNISEAEQKCWDTINDLSKMVFTKQKIVLDELETDLSSLNVTDDFKSMIKSTTDILRSNMEFALKALDDGRADDYFDALFDTSENIITLSTLLKSPSIEDEAFFVLVKAVSRLGRNNSALVQELTSVCASRMMTRPKNTKPAIDLPIKE